MSEKRQDIEVVAQLNMLCPPDAENYKGNTTNDDLGFMLERKFIELCQVAKMDAWHDHHTISNLMADDIDNFVMRHLPITTDDNQPINCYNSTSGSSSRSASTPGSASSASGQGRPSDEDVFIYRMFLNKENLDNVESQKMCKPLCNPLREDKYIGYGSDIFNNIITSRYNVGHVQFTSASKEEESGSYNKDCPEFDENQSMIEKFFVENQITEDIFIIRDVAYGNWADDIAKWGKGDIKTNNNIITIQTAAGIFDPGPSTHCFTTAGKRQGFLDVESKSRYALFESYSEDNFHQDETVILYPKVEDDDDDDDKPLLRNQLLYTRFDCVLYGKTLKLPQKTIYSKEDVMSFIDSANVNFVVSVPDPNDSEKNNIYITTKKNSNKAQSIAELPINDSIIKMEASSLASKKGPGTYDPRLFDRYGRDYIINSSGQLKIMTKKFGDHGQAVTACRETLSYRLIEPIDATATRFNIISGKSNGFHAFLSFDRVAVASAIYYGTPIVIFVNHDGAIIFTSKEFDKFKTVSAQYQTIKSAIIRKQKEYVYLTVSRKVMVDTDLFNEQKKDISAKLPNIINFLQIIYNYLMQEDISDKKAPIFDIVYQTFISLLYVISPFINLFTTHINVSKIVKHGLPPPMTLPDSISDDNKEILDSAKEHLAVVNEKVSKLSGNISLYEITEDTKEKITMISNFCEEIITKQLDPYKSINSLKSKLKLNSITKKLIESFNPYVGSQKSTMRHNTNKLKGQIGCEIGITLIEEIYQNMGHYLFEFRLKDDKVEITDLKNIFSSILHSIFLKATPTAMPFFLTSIGREQDGDSTKSLTVVDDIERESINSQIEYHATQIHEKENEIKNKEKQRRDDMKGKTKDEKQKIKENYVKKIEKIENIKEKIENSKLELYTRLAQQENSNMNYERSQKIFLENTFSKTDIVFTVFSEEVKKIPTEISDLEMFTEVEETVSTTDNNYEINTDFELESAPLPETTFSNGIKSLEQKSQPIKKKKRKQENSTEIRRSSRLAAKRKLGGGIRKKRTKNKNKKLENKTRKRRTRRKRQMGGRDVIPRSSYTLQNNNIPVVPYKEDIVNMTTNDNRKGMLNMTTEYLKKVNPLNLFKKSDQTSFDFLQSNIKNILTTIQSDKSRDFYRMINNYKKVNELLYINDVVLSMLTLRLPLDSQQTGGGERDKFLTKENINAIHAKSKISTEIQNLFNKYVNGDLKTFVGYIKGKIESNDQFEIKKNSNGNNFTIYDKTITINGIALLKHLVSNNVVPTPEQLLVYKKEILTKYIAQEIENIRTEKVFEDVESTTLEKIQQKLNDINKKEAELDVDDNECEVSSNIIVQTIITDKKNYNMFMEFLCGQYNEFQQFDMLDINSEILKNMYKEIEKNISTAQKTNVTIENTKKTLEEKLESDIPQEVEIITIEDAENADTLEEIEKLLS